MHRSGTNGFTLIELMITLMVAALLLAWGVPTFQNFINRTTLTSETNNWVGVINFARNEAITRGERVTVCRREDPELCDGTSNCQCGVGYSGGSSPPNYHSGYLIFTSTGNSGTLNFVAANNELIRTGRAQSDKVTIQGNGQANNAFSFMPNGMLAEDDQGPPTARHIICVVANTADVSGTAESTTTVPGRAVIISGTGRPRVAEFEVGGDCYDSNGSNSAADGSSYGE